ncbi:MAG TPA: MraY family glycosyltransferase [Chloroflexia bacterium]|nr:MraY family glycosyltransferase [Chloroflexia bacterium]
MTWGMLLVGAVTLAASLILTRVLRSLALRRGWYDQPGDPRRIHTVPTPRIGGVAMYLAFMIGLTLTLVPGVMPERLSPDSPPFGPPELWRVGLLALGATIITAVMFVDDLRGLRPIPKLLWQLFVAGLVMLPDPRYLYLTPAHNIPGVPNGMLTGVVASFIQNPFGDEKHRQIQLLLPLAILLTFFWIVGMMNAVNFMDGLDGLAGGVTVVACAVLFAVSLFSLGQTTIAFLPLILGAAALGFLRYNFHPAQIFMGDSGSMFLGFALGVISIIGGAKIATALLVLAVPIMDVAYVIIFRLLRGHSPLRADRGHLHHRLFDLGWGQRLIAVVFYGVCGTVGGGLAFLPPGQGLIKLGVLVLIAVLLGALLMVISRRQFDRARNEAGRDA